MLDLFVLHWSMLFIQEYLVNVLIQYKYIRDSTDRSYFRDKLYLLTCPVRYVYRETNKQHICVNMQLKKHLRN